MKERSLPPESARILAVDDQESQLLALSGVLDELGDELVGVTSGRAALERAASEEFAVILLDLSMPEMDGYETATHLRALPLSRATPIIFLTGGPVTSATPLSAYAAGAVDFLTKPFVPEVLRSKVQVFVELFRIRRAAQLHAELLRQSEEKQRIFSQLTSDFTAVLAVGPDGTLALESLSDAFVRVTGHGAADLFAADAPSIVHEEDRAGVAAALGALKTGHAAKGAFRVITRGGETRYLRFWARATTGADGGVTRILAAAQDVTEQRKLEEELRQAQKLEAVGRLAGGIAHDFNNMLTVIVGNAQIQLAEAGSNDEIRESAAQIRDAAERAASLVAQLLAFSRRQLLTLTSFDLNDVVRKMEIMLRRVIGEHVTLTTSLAREPLVLHADRGRLEQVLVNLVMNSRDALPAGGTITISTALSDHRVMLAVADTGVGMDAQTRAQIFEPYFTTKAVGKGTGLGLSMVHGVVHQSGGQVDVESTPGRGTTFRIWLPANEGAVPSAAPRPEATAARGSGTVLIVEDEPAVRRLARMSLEQAGYRVIEAADGPSALAAAEAQPEIDLLVTDVVMPGLTGPVLFERLRAVRPQLKVLYMSGYPEGAAGHVEAGESFLPKPFTPAILRLRVNKVLGR